MFCFILARSYMSDNSALVISDCVVVREVSSHILRYTDDHIVINTNICGVNYNDMQVK